jgi:hypothetical protein
MVARANSPHVHPAARGNLKEHIMQFTDTTPRSERSISGVAVQIAAPYAAGHVLTEGEASQLNQVLFENVSNNLREKIKLGVVSGEGENQTAVPHTTETAQPIVDKFLAEYEMGVRRAGSGEVRVTDPVEKEARKIAREQAVLFVKNNGGKPADFDMGEITSKIFEGNRDVLMKAAKKIVDQREKALSGASEFDLTGVDLTAKAPAAAAA